MFVGEPQLLSLIEETAVLVVVCLASDERLNQIEDIAAEAIHHLQAQAARPSTGNIDLEFIAITKKIGLERDPGTNDIN